MRGQCSGPRCALVYNVGHLPHDLHRAIVPPPMKTKPSKIVTIAQKSGPEILSKEQKLFKRLIKKIDAQRVQLHAWQATVPLYQQKHAAELMPLMDAFNEQRVRLVHLFDGVYDNKIFSDTDRRKIADLIGSVAGDLLARKDPDPVLKSIFNKYHHADFDAQGEEDKAEVKAMMQEMFGVEVDEDIDLNDPEKLILLMAEKARAMHERDAAAALDKNAKRKKTTKQLAREAKLEEEEKNISQSIREVFRKLASALHPDREQDAEERLRKTALMQRVNVAYGNKDLLQLLELQLEVEQIDEAMINTLSEERLKHYNQILKEQSKDLEIEAAQNEIMFRARFQIDESSILAPAYLMAMLECDIRDLRGRIKDIARDLQDFEQVKKIKAWLKGYY